MITTNAQLANANLTLGNFDTGLYLTRTPKSQLSTLAPILMPTGWARPGFSAYPYFGGMTGSRTYAWRCGPV
jgi:hypothetical protein